MTLFFLFSKLSTRIPCIKKKLKGKWQLASNAFTDGHRLIVTLQEKEMKPATKKQFEAKTDLPWNAPKFERLPELQCIPRNRFELAQSLKELDVQYEVIGIDPGVKQVLAWTHNNVPGFYRLEEYRHDFGLNLNERWRAFHRNKQTQTWIKEEGQNYFALHSQISLKQINPEAMIDAITKLKDITKPLFEFYQRACFNRMNFWLYKRKQRGFEKIAHLLTCGRKPSTQKNWTRRQRKRRRRRKEKIKKRWIPIHSLWKEIQEKKKKEEEEKKKKEEEEKKKKEEEEEKQKGKKKRQEEKQMLPESKRKKRIATAERRAKKNRNKKEFKPMEPSMDVDANNFPAPVVETPRTFLLCDQIASLSCNSNQYQERINEIKSLIEPPKKKQPKKKQSNKEEEKKKKEEEQKKKREANKKKRIEMKVLSLKKQLIDDFNKKKKQIWPNAEKREEARNLLTQLNRKGETTTVSSTPLPRESENEAEMPKRLVVAFGAAKFATRGVPREKIKEFLRGKKIPVYEINEFYTSQKCAECGEVKRKKETSKFSFSLFFKKKQTKKAHSRCVYCEKCKQFHNRDSNAARNMTTAWNYMALFRKRPQYLKKKNNISD